MSFHVLGAPLDFEKNEARNLRVHNLSTAPASPALGQIYYDTDDNNLYVWDGAWTDLTVQGGGISYGTPSQTINAGDAASAGASTNVLREDAQFAVSTGAASTISGSNAEGTSTALARADHNHALGSSVVGSTQIASNAVTPGKISNVSTDDFTFPRDISVVRDVLQGTTSLLRFGSAATDVAIKKDANAVLGVKVGNDTAYASLKALNLTATTGIDINGVAVVLTNDARLHTQNTDTGTNSAFFTFAGTGVNDVRIKKNGNFRLDVRKGDDSDWATVQTGALTVNGDLTVTGTTTTVNSNTVSIGDNIFELNNDVTTTAGSTENAGLTVKRYTGADVRQDSQWLWDESLDRWTGVYPASSGTGTVTKIAAFKYEETLGAVTANTPVTVTHNLNTQNVAVSIRRASDNALVGAVVIPNAVNTITVTFSQSAAASAYIVTVIG